MTLHIVQNEAEYDEWQRMVELSEAFAPATVPHLADAVWLMNIQIHKLRARRDHLEKVVLDHCMAHGQVTGPKTGKTCYVQDYVAETKYDGSPVWKYKLGWRR